VDKAKAGTLKKALPIEAFMTDRALSELAKRNAPASEPVHAENLTAITAAEGRRRQTFSGESLPGHPQVRRVVPAPFRRPSITAGSHGKSYRFLHADQIKVDDIIPDIGLVTAVKEEIVYSTRAEVLGLLPGRPAPGEVDTSLALLPGLDGKSVYAGNMSDKIAVGLAIIVIGSGDMVKAFRENDDVQVFRKHES
jgi:hypothetical protein